MASPRSIPAALAASRSAAAATPARAELGPGIAATINSASNTSDILINRTGTVSGPNGGIAASTMGTGNITVSGIGNVGGDSATASLLAATGGNVTVTDGGNVLAPGAGSGIVGTTSGAGTY